MLTNTLERVDGAGRPNSLIRELREHGRDTVAMHYQTVVGVVAYMRRNLAEPLDVKTLSRVAAMSRFHFIRTFAEVTGITPGHFVSCLRIERAKQLLLETPEDVTEICMAVGYSSLGSFSSTFTDLVGLPPSKYRQLNREFNLHCFQARAAAFLEAQLHRSGPFLAGRIEASEHHQGLAFVGVYKSGVPEGLPESGTIVLTLGEYRIPRPQRSSFHLLAVLLPPGAFNPRAKVTESIENVASARVLEFNSNCDRLPTLTMRRLKTTDPPILVDLSLLLQH